MTSASNIIVQSYFEEDGGGEAFCTKQPPQRQRSALHVKDATMDGFMQSLREPEQSGSAFVHNDHQLEPNRRAAFESSRAQSFCTRHNINGLAAAEESQKSKRSLSSIIQKRRRPNRSGRQDSSRSMGGGADDDDITSNLSSRSDISKHDIASNLSSRSNTSKSSKSMKAKFKATVHAHMLAHSLHGKSKRQIGDANDAHLYETLPPHIADALMHGRKVTPANHECATVFFAGVHNIDIISEIIGPDKTTNMVQRLHSCFDELAQLHEVFPVVSGGSAYMAVTNVVKDQNDSHVRKMAQFAMDAAAAAVGILIDLDDPSRCVQICGGFHCGAVISDVKGRIPTFEVSGDTCCVALSLATSSKAGMIQCSDYASMLLRRQEHNIPITARDQAVEIVGEGLMNTFWVGDTNLNKVLDCDNTDYSPTSEITIKRKGSQKDVEENEEKSIGHGEKEEILHRPQLRRQSSRSMSRERALSTSSRSLSLAAPFLSTDLPSDHEGELPRRRLSRRSRSREPEGRSARSSTPRLEESHRIDSRNSVRLCSSLSNDAGMRRSIGAKQIDHHLRHDSTLKEEAMAHKSSAIMAKADSRLRRESSLVGGPHFRSSVAISMTDPDWAFSDHDGDKNTEWAESLESVVSSKRNSKSHEDLDEAMRRGKEAALAEAGSNSKQRARPRPRSNRSKPKSKAANPAISQPSRRGGNIERLERLKQIEQMEARVSAWGRGDFEHETHKANKNDDDRSLDPRRRSRIVSQNIVVSNRTKSRKEPIEEDQSFTHPSEEDHYAPWEGDFATWSSSKYKVDSGRRHQTNKNRENNHNEASLLKALRAGEKQINEDRLNDTMLKYFDQRVGNSYGNTSG